MSQLLNSYPLFEGNQVLTSSQLNQLVAYLDEQNRLTRAKLIGTGIFCGLELSLGDSATGQTLTIQKGTGVTSEGFLMSLDDCVLNRYKEYSLPANVSYPPFENPETTVQDVLLYEMITPNAEVLPGEVVLPLDDPTGFLNDKVVLLFLECSDIDLKSCLGQSCDERGMDRVFNVRKLLISKSDMDLVLSRTCTQSGLFPDQYSLPEFLIRRPLFDPESEESSDYFSFSQNYVNKIRGDDFISPFTTIQTDLYGKLFDALRKTYTDFAAILSPIYGGTDPFDGLPTPAWTDFLNGDSDGPNFLGVQYFYDFIKDLILAYNEFRDCAFDLMSDCCVDLDCFPKHLMLGTAVPEVLSAPSQYRHELVLSPAFDGQNELLAKAVMLHKRMVIMTRQFNLATINNPSVEPIPPSDLGVPMFITPSNEKRDPLSLRSIPYYYNINATEVGLGTLIQNWNYTYTEKFLFSKGLQPLSYGGQDIVQSNDQGPILTPLYYDTDQYNFLRIEGAIRQNYVDVTAQLEDLQQRFDLPFNIVTLRLTGESLDDITERCNFDDIRTEYGTLRTEISSMLQKLFDRYATNTGGSIRLTGFPTYIQALLNQADSGTDLGSVTQPQVGEQVFQSLNPNFDFAERSTDERIVSDADVRERFVSPDRNFVIGSTATSPVFAPQRNLSQAIADFDNNIFQMASKINDILTAANLLPFDIVDFDYGYTGQVQNETDGFIQTYLDAVQFGINAKVALNQIFDLVTHSLKLSNNAKTYFDLALYLQEVLGQFEDFICDSSYQSLTLLNYTYQYRFQYIKDNDQTLFSNFIRKHPGIEHQAGVPRGGTYVMLVNGDGLTVDKPSRDFAVAQIRNLQNLKLERAQLQEKTFNTVEDTQVRRRLDSQILQIETVQAELAIGTPVVAAEQFLLESFQVIADFTLPYLCCCDCECDDIPAPENESELGIPALAVPFYAEYSLGDYAYGKGIAQAMPASPPSSRIINVIPSLQYDTSRYSATQIRLFLIDRNGDKLLPRQIGQISIEPDPTTRSTFVDETQMETFNAPNNPSNTTSYGTVSVRTYNTGQAPQFIYTPKIDFTGTDSWLYMFEIWDSNDNVLQRSTCGQVTMSVTG